MGSGDILLEARKLRKDFGGVVAIDGFSFSVLQGQIVAIIGPNGAGKTTAFNLVTGVHQLNAGEIHFCSQRIDGLKPYEISERGISRTFQNLQIFNNMSVVENVMVGRHCRSRAGILSGALSLPNSRSEEQQIHAAALSALDAVGLLPRATERASALPFGSQRVLELARALATEPNLLLLDEPAAGLSGQETQNLAQLIHKIRERGVSILLVEHDMELVMGIADWVFVLDYGKMIAEGTPAQIQADQKVIAAYLGDETA